MLPPPNITTPSTMPVRVTVRDAASEKITTAMYFTPSRRARSTGTVSRYRSVPVFASPATASPDMAATANGRKSPSSIVSAARATKRPFSVMEGKKSGPSPRCGADVLTATEIITGTAARTTRPARLRRLRKINRSSERRNRVEIRRGDGTRTSAADIEALPGQREEDLFQGGRPDAEAKNRDALVHARRDDLLGRDAVQPARRAAVLDAHVEESELGHDPAGLGRRVGLDDGFGLGTRAQLCGRALGDELPDVHHADVRADLFDLGQQMAGHEHGCAVIGQRRHQRPNLTGALRVEPVRRLVEHQQVPRA